MISMLSNARWAGLALERVALRAGERRLRFQSQYVVVLPESGRGVFRCGGRRHPCSLERGCVFASAGLWTAEATSAGGCSYAALTITPRTWRALVEHIGTGEHVPERGTSWTIGRPALEAGRRLADAFERRSHLVQGIGPLIDFVVASAQSPRATMDTDIPVAVVRARTYLERQCRDIASRQLARCVGLSPFHFIRTFRQALGVPPRTYAALVRLGRAEQLLRAGVPIADAANRAGFYDQSHLNRCFRRVLGMTPGEYRKPYLVRYRLPITLDTVLAFRLRNGEPLLRRWAQLRQSIGR